MQENVAKQDEMVPQGENALKLKELEEQIDGIKDKLEAITKAAPEDKLSMVVFSGELDKVLAAFVIATGAVAMGMEVIMFFTFWGTPVLRDKKKQVGGKDFMGKMFGSMLPKGSGAVKLSKMNMGGMGTMMMKSLMQKKNVASLDQMIEMAGELGVQIYVCDMSMNLMGFKPDEMIDYPKLDYCGVAKFLEQAMGSKVQLFI
jgi:peroxiredoxin family protein